MEEAVLRSVRALVMEEDIHSVEDIARELKLDNWTVIQALNAIHEEPESMMHAFTFRTGRVYDFPQVLEIVQDGETLYFRDKSRRIVGRYLPKMGSIKAQGATVLRVYDEGRFTSISEHDFPLSVAEEFAKLAGC